MLRHSSATFGVCLRKRMSQQHNEERILTNFYDFIFIYFSSTEKISMIFMWCFYIMLYVYIGPDSSIGITTDYRLDGPWSNLGGDEIFPPVQTGPGALPNSSKLGIGSFPAVKCGRDVLLTTHPLLVLRSRKSRAIPLPTLWATPGL